MTGLDINERIVYSSVFARMRSCWLLLVLTLLLGSGGVKGSTNQTPPTTITPIDLKQLEGTWVVQESKPFMDNLAAYDRRFTEAMLNTSVARTVCMRSTISEATPTQARQQIRVVVNGLVDPSSEPHVQTFTGTIHLKHNGSVPYVETEFQGLPRHRSRFLLVEPARYYVSVTYLLPESAGEEEKVQYIFLYTRVPLSRDETWKIWFGKVDNLPGLGIAYRRTIKYGMFCNQ